MIPPLHWLNDLSTNVLYCSCFMKDLSHFRYSSLSVPTITHCSLFLIYCFFFNLVLSRVRFYVLVFLSHLRFFLSWFVFSLYSLVRLSFDVFYFRVSSSHLIFLHVPCSFTGVFLGNMQACYVPIPVHWITTRTCG